MNEISCALFLTPTNKQIISKLREQEKKVFLFPAVETEKLSPDAFAENAVRNAVNFDWLIFTDVFTVDYFIDFLQEFEIDLFELDAVRICAFGGAVSDRLRFSEIHADIIASVVETASIFKALNDYIGAETFANQKYLVLKELSGKIELTEKIKEMQAKVSEISLYRILDRDKTEITKIKALLTGGAFDEIIFSEPADLVAFMKMFDGANPQGIFSDIRFSAVNEVMYQMLFENGFRPVFFDRK